jgi:DNA-binding SARP family transcriptional activator
MRTADRNAVCSCLHHVYPRTDSILTELTIQLLGTLRVLDSRGTEIKVPSRKGRALLAYIALRSSESHGRDRLAALLWEDADEDLARTSLRQAIAALRKALPESCQRALLTTTDSVSLNPESVETDFNAFRDALQAATRTSLQQAVDLYRGDLLDGFDARSAAFDDWLNTERLSLRRQACEALQRLTQICSANEDADGALRACARLVMLEPLNESAHRTLMELHARRGAYAEALRQFRICKDALRRELDVAPEPATEQLYRDLMRRRRASNEPPSEDGAARHEDETDRSQSAPEATARIEARPQLRDAVVLVARLEGLLELEAMLDPEDTHVLASAFQERVQRVVQEFGGTADRRVGSNVLAVFGVPTAYGNEAECGARAALMLRDSVEHDPWPINAHLNLRIGLAEGQVLCTNDLFPLSGRPTHLAHTLASRALDGEILISEELRQSLGERVGSKRNADDDLLGASMPAWSLDSIRSDDSASDHPFVGRRPELAMILASLDRCASSRHGRAIVVRGEAGIGKSRLVEAVSGAARERGVEVHSAQVFDFGQSPGRGPINTLALSLMGAEPGASDLERAAAVRRLLAARGGSIDQSIFLSDVVDAPIEAELAALEKAMDTTTRQRGRSLALAQIVESAAQRCPQLLVVEDVHWADTDELARLGEIAAVVANCPILLIMTTRPEGDPMSATWRARARGCPVTTVDLAPLAQDEAEELAAHYPELPRDTINECIVRAEGYPLFLDQLLRAANAGSGALPGSVRTLVIARVDRLSNLDHRAVQAGAILGQRFSLGALRHMIRQADYDPAALIDTDLVRSDGNELQFAHALFRDAIYESTLKSERRELHRSAAAWFAERDIALYADHLSAAQDEAAAAAYASAARAEQNALRYERALNLATKAAAVAHEPALLHQTSSLLGELLLQLGRTHDALTAYREALDFAVDPGGRGHAWFGVAATLRVMDRHEEALDALDRAEAQLEQIADAETRARLWTLRGNLCFPLGHLDACLQAHEQAHRYAVEAHSPLEIARALGGLGDAYYQRGQMITARRHFAQCVQEARQHNLAGVLLANLPMLGVTEIYYGTPTAGRDSLKEALELANRIGDLRSQLLVHLCMASGLTNQARFDEALARARRALEIAEQLGARRFQAECMGIVSAAKLAAGERNEALRSACEGVQLGRETGMSYCGPVLLSLVARATDDPQERANALQEGEALLHSGCVSHSYLEFYTNAIEVCLEQGQWSEACRYAKALESYTEREPLPLSNLMIRRARLLAEVGKETVTAQVREELEAVRDECLRINALTALKAVEKALGKPVEA